ncbi:hypothetical protein UFOVP406_32 [uncultured Caudovirales phage]|uniref:Uncharacterized protein n=1 Tax=uncultured Caudovirales phage TaxID=2100421 RepID=A0A6J5M152_9CAUD|nr:hypothetical protein UFOVP406_32 [uncultured Caudovirales phage]
MSDLKDLIWRIQEKMPVDHAELLDLVNRIEALTAENEKLREALEWAADHEPLLVDEILSRAGLEGEQ